MTSSAGWLVHRYETLASTMDRAALLAHAGARERTAVISHEQTAGRGRGGRTWKSAPGHALACTLILRPNVPASRLAVLSLVAGLAVAETIEEITAMPVRLKWPNDVWLGSDPDHLKVAGILLTSSLSGSDVVSVLLGVGVNASTPLAELPAGGVSILSASGRVTSPETIFNALLRRIDRGYAAFLASEGRPSLEGWRARAALLGEHVSIADAGRAFSGIHAGVDDDGALLLAQADGQVRRIVSGDLIRGPRAISQLG